jgi:hypothetical protein
MTRRERRQPTRAEWAAITSRRPVFRRIAPLAKRERFSGRPDNSKRGDDDRRAG